MRKKAIPVKHFKDKNTAGIVIEKMLLNDLSPFKEEIVNSYEEQGQVCNLAILTTDLAMLTTFKDFGYPEAL